MELAEKEEKSDVLIKRIANVLESNILLFDRDTDPESVYLFHSSGNKYSHLNLFNKLAFAYRVAKLKLFASISATDAKPRNVTCKL